MKRRFAIRIVAAIGVSALVAACAPMMDSGDDIVDVVVSKNEFSTLVEAVQAAGLLETLKSEGPFTVFAPTNHAFAKLPAGTVESLLKPENKDKLLSILTYHVVRGAVTSDQIVGQRVWVKTLQGSSVGIDGINGIKVDGADVVVANVVATNGIIHVIDSVILP